MSAAMVDEPAGQEPAVQGSVGQEPATQEPAGQESAGALMTAWQVTSAGEPLEVMRLARLPRPRPGPGQVAVRVSATALNFPDALLARGQYQERPPWPFTPGIELCGEIEAVGAGVDPLRIGERVIGAPALPHGALAELCLARAEDMLPAPAALDDATASAFFIAYQTGWFGLYRRAALRVGETLLVHAAAGGVGSAAVQLGRAAGARVIAVVGAPDKVEVARRLGAQQVIDRSTLDGALGNLVAAIKDAAGPKGVDVVYDPVGGDSFQASTKVVAFEGRILVIGFAGGSIPSLPMNHPLVKNYSVLGLHWGLYRTRAPELVRRAHEDLTTLAAAGALQPLISRRMPFEEAAQGLTQLAAGRTVGRLVVLQP
jgi:NADPH:quinone reductase